MGRKKKKIQILEEVLITGVADKGKSVGKHEERVVFVEGAVPGDVVNIRVRKKRKKYFEGIVNEILTPSKDRTEAFCQHFGECGGCKWQNITYEAQLRHKQQVVVDALTRIAKVDVNEILPIVRAEKTRYHRNKVEFTFSNRRWLSYEEIKMDTEFVDRKALGFHRPGGYDRIVDIKECFLQADPSNAIRNELKRFAVRYKYDFYDIRENAGFLRNVIFRIVSTGEIMLIVSFKYEDEVKRRRLLDHLLATFPAITSLHYVINPKMNDFILDLDIKCYKGKGYIEEYLRDLKFKIGPKSFFQTNSEQAVVLYDKIVEFAELEGHENVYDLYTGIGSIACYVAKHCKQVVGIEEVDLAIEDAKENAKINNIENTVFYAGDVKDILTTEFADKHGKPDLIITDPPRAGMHPKVVKMLVELAAPKMVYVSCNPATQARDFEVLKEIYDIIKVQPVDMFPHTHHIEDVALLKLKQ